MSKKKLNVVFMGTPDFAVPCLQRILDDGHRVSGVFTQPDKPKGRHYTLTPPPVKVLAESCGIPVLQPEKMKAPEVLEALKSWAPDIIVVVAYGKILPEEVLNLPPMGCINVHGSLLPKYRGAAPIQWSVIHGDKVTGVTTMFMAKGLDTGDMIVKKETPIGDGETAGELYDRLCLLGAEALSETLELAMAGPLPREPQREEEASYVSTLNKEMARLDFKKPAKELYDLVRGLNPWPVAFTTLDGKVLKVFRASLVGMVAGEPGTLAEEGSLIVCCGDGQGLAFEELLLQGSRRMDAKQFLMGRKLPKGTLFGKE